MKQRFFLLVLLVGLFNACSEEKEIEYIFPLPFLTEEAFLLKNAKDSLPGNLAVFQFKDELLNAFPVFSDYPMLFTYDNRSVPFLKIPMGEIIWEEWLTHRMHKVLPFENAEIVRIDSAEKENAFSFYWGNGCLNISNITIPLETIILGKEDELLSELDEEEKKLGASIRKLKYWTWEEDYGIKDKKKLLDRHVVADYYHDKNEVLKGRFLTKNKKTFKGFDGQDEALLNLLPNHTKYFAVQNFIIDNDSISCASFMVHSMIEDKDALYWIQKIHDEELIWNKLENEVGFLEEEKIGQFTIRKVAKYDMQDDWLGLSYLPYFHFPYVVKIGDYLMFSSTKSGLIQMVEKYVTGSNLKSSDDWLGVDLVLDEMGGMKQNNHFLLEDDKVCAFQVFEEGGNEYFQSYTYNKIPKNKPINLEKVWTYQTKGEIYSLHYEGIEVLPIQGGKAVFFQDTYFDLYALSHKGILLFKSKVGKVIQSGVHHCRNLDDTEDRYVFHTGNTLFVLDQNGNHVNNSPIQFSGDNVLEDDLELIDIPNANAIYVFVVNQKGQLYGYDLSKEMKLIPKWNPFHLGVQGHNGIKVLDGKEKRRMVFSTKNNQFLMTDMNGEILKMMKGNDFYVRGISERLADEYFVIKSRHYEYLILDINGGVFTTNSLGDHRTDFAHIDMQGDARKEFVFSDQKKITIFDLKDSSLIHMYEIDNSKMKIHHIFNVENAEGKYFMAGLNWHKNKIYIFDRKGNLLPEFPLPGKYPFQSIPLKNGKTLLTIPDGKTINAFVVDW